MGYADSIYVLAAIFGHICWFPSVYFKCVKLNTVNHISSQKEKHTYFKALWKTWISTDLWIWIFIFGLECWSFKEGGWLQFIRYAKLHVIIMGGGGCMQTKSVWHLYLDFGPLHCSPSKNIWHVVSVFLQFCVITLTSFRGTHIT